MGGTIPRLFMISGIEQTITSGSPSIINIDIRENKKKVFFFSVKIFLGKKITIFPIISRIAVENCSVDRDRTSVEPIARVIKTD